MPCIFRRFSIIIPNIVNRIFLVFVCSFSSSIPYTVQCVLLVLHNKEYTYLLTYYRKRCSMFVELRGIRWVTTCLDSTFAARPSLVSSSARDFRRAECRIFRRSWASEVQRWRSWWAEVAPRWPLDRRMVSRTKFVECEDSEWHICRTQRKTTAAYRSHQTLLIVR